MKASRSLDGALSSTVLSRHCPTVPNRPVRAGQAVTRSLLNSRRAVAVTSPRSSCSKSSQWLLSTFVSVTAKTPGPRHSRSQHGPVQRGYGTATAVADQALHGQDVKSSVVSDEAEGPSSSSFFTQRRKEELLSYVGQNGYFGQRQSDSQLTLGSEGNASRIRGVAPADFHKDKSETRQMEPEGQATLTDFYAAISKRIRHPSQISLESIFDLYQLLPEPRMQYVDSPWRNRFLKVMGLPERRDVDSMLRYFALISDMKKAGITLQRRHWNYALAFATKYTSSLGSKTEEMEAALRLWREMEHEGKVAGNEVTFNVLFDVAVKAGSFQLAEMIYREMTHRGIEFNRYHHVSLIYYHGLKMDSAGIRAAYQDMVEAGEMVDAVVLNCVISGLLRCGEESAAEETYEKMKTGHALATEIPQRDYTMNKVITKVLMMFSRVGKQHPALKDTLQQNVHLAPDLHTYRLLVSHYATKVGNLQKVARYLDEMKLLRIPVHPVIFLCIFKGFYAHGGFEGSEWSEKRLHGVLAALYRARDDHSETFRLDRWVVIWALRAVKKCASSPDAVAITFEEMSRRWDIPADRQPWMHNLLEVIVSGRDLNSELGDWEGPANNRRKKDGSEL